MLPIKTVSESNQRGHWAKKARRARQQRDAAYLVIRSAISAGGLPDGLPEHRTIFLTRISPRKLDSDNLSSSLKAVRDGVADALGIDDGDERFEWRYAQERGKVYSVRVEIV